MSTYSLFVNPKLHSHLIDLFKKTGSSGSVHTDLSNFPGKIRSTPSILVYETNEIISGDDRVKAFLNEHAPQKPVATRVPRKKPVVKKEETKVEVPEQKDEPVVENTPTPVVETPKELEPLKKPTKKRTSTRKQQAPKVEISTEKPKIDDDIDDLLL